MNENEIFATRGSGRTVDREQAAGRVARTSEPADPVHRPTHTDLMVAPESVPDLAPQPIHPEILRLARAAASPGAEDMVDHMTADDLETLVDVVIGRLQERDRWRAAAQEVTDHTDSDPDEWCDITFLVAGRER